MGQPRGQRNAAAAKSRGEVAEVVEDGRGGGKGREAEEGKSLAVESFYKPLSNSRERRTLAASGRG